MSVFVPAYRQARFLERCLDSVAASTYQNLECHVLDDCSPDVEYDVFQRWFSKSRDQRFSFVRNSENLGISRSLNVALSRTKSEFVAFVAADDLVHPSGIAERVAYLRERPELAAVFGDAEVIDEEGRPISPSALTTYRVSCGKRPMRPSLLSDPRWLPYELAFNWAVPGPVFLARRSVFSVVGMYDEGSAVEDWDMYLRLAHAGLLGYIDRVVASYRVHHGSSVSMANATGYHDQSLLRTVSRHSQRSTGLIRMRMRQMAAKYALLASRSGRIGRAEALRLALAAVALHAMYAIYRTSSSSLSGVAANPHCDTKGRSPGIRHGPS